MRSTILRVLVAFALLGTGWVAAQAQISEPDFELVVEAPAGPTTVTCVRGCRLKWVERSNNANSKPMQSFDFSCQGGGVQRCSSARVGGWVTP
jgi:hypothetical protein